MRVSIVLIAWMITSVSAVDGGASVMIDMTIMTDMLHAHYRNKHNAIISRASAIRVGTRLNETPIACAGTIPTAPIVCA
ncbi:hypothetical protein ACKLNO_09580 [Neisseriaceae bacterium B1]